MICVTNSRDIVTNSRDMCHELTTGANLVTRFLFDPWCIFDTIVVVSSVLSLIPSINLPGVSVNMRVSMCMLMCVLMYVCVCGCACVRVCVCVCVCEKEREIERVCVRESERVSE